MALLDIIVIGGGFSAASFTLHLLDLAAQQGVQPGTFRLRLIEPRLTLGAGIAYSARDPNHRINVAATRMNWSGDGSDDFDRWTRETGAVAEDPAMVWQDGSLYPARAVFGHYMHTRLMELTASSPQIAFEHVRQRAEAVAAFEDRYRVRLADGSSLEADLVVLATGHPPPNLPRGLEVLAGSDRFIADPWRPGAVADVQADDRVLLVGTGLTMGDMVASLRTQGCGGQMMALSRRGLIPRPRASTVEAFGDCDFSHFARVSQSLKAMRSEIRKARGESRPWSDVLERIRQQNMDIWAAWPQAERRRFLRHLKPYWDVHRFQAAPQIDSLVKAVCNSRHLTIEAGSIVGARPHAKSIEVDIKPRGLPAERAKTHVFERVVNCTGASGAHITRDDPIFASLAEQRLVRSDSLRIGLDLDSRSHPVSCEGKSVTGLFVIGPAARGCLGEVTGAPELALQARRVAEWVLEAGTLKNGDQVRQKQLS
ncbi:FAD/NAD(P)-binding protein [Beijerinckia indica]|uniref:Pyridine nucleotide-disulfide oxidoreductase family n=1 Tax=Beijerinckia indica subsp. indica (strain ATCC 9039 / DSM 1715 / NCIMB 8712) TaxID=395963 RepID=B2IFA7_BEII9|nr:FAD/NAD(P)-binding protein [Beijerinckia indica]ACB95672.1 pyridine nucleotide-disulfide oxidoreductase family [Beijerinckia indica subsp. indica ATCC 9039]